MMERLYVYLKIYENELLLSMKAINYEIMYKLMNIWLVWLHDMYSMGFDLAPNEAWGGRSTCIILI